MNRIKVDKPFLFTVLLLTGVGFLMFYSAALSLTIKETGSSSVVLMQTLGLIAGLIGLFICSKIPYTFWRKYSLIVFVTAIVINLLIFIPSLGLEHGGARRWIHIGSITIQPSEFLKIGYIIYLASWLNKYRDKINSLKSGVIPFIVISSVVAVLMLIQRDTDTMIVILGTGFIMIFVAGIKFRYLGYIAILGIILMGGIIFTRPYAMERIKTFFDPSHDTQGSSYQIKQSLIAIGSGGLVGRGLGQSVQKFNYLPEPIGDSIFAVGAEEFGFIGTITLVLLYLFFVIRGLRIASKSLDLFARLVVVGIVILVVVESYMNISSMLGIIPLSGMPLLFVSHGGTALALIISQMGIVLNISASRKSR
ncbi:MAG: putative peptidoglycan glycosyltransferase FtsW [bacterium]|nr:putative peptidoglycan glycosyltransferase FtsW [bacterium]